MASEIEQNAGPSNLETASVELTEKVDDLEEFKCESEDYSPLGSGSDDPEKQQNYNEYKRLIKEIKCQNDILENIKGKISAIKCKTCTTLWEQNDLQGLYDCLENEMAKLQCLINRAMQLQNFGSRRRYKEIPLVTTIDEDNMTSVYRTCENLQAQTSMRDHGSIWRQSLGKTSELELSSSCQDTMAYDHKGGQLCESEDKQIMRDIFAALKASGSSSKKLCQIKRHHHCKRAESKDNIKDKIECMQQMMNKLKNEICKHDIENKLSENEVTPCIAPLCPGKKSDELQKLKENYLYLLTEFSKKDEQLKELTKKLKLTCCSCKTGGSGALLGDGNADESELYLLRNRVNEMKEEQVEFKCLMREQSLQLDDYRNKYLSAQQKVEEQCALLEKLNMNNKRIEKQINLEVKEIRAKFQEKLNELLQFPKLLENEQIKLAQTCKEKEELESKLVIVCKELKSLKLKMDNKNNDEDCKPQLERCQQELSQVKKSMEEIQRQRDLFCEQLRTTVDDLDTLRSESANIIARSKERAELVKKQQQEQIDCLEKQLAQCRATACLSVSDREAVIREMQGQLNTLSNSFDAAQKQIKTLRNHIAYMSNENCFPAKC